MKPEEYQIIKEMADKGLPIWYLLNVNGLIIGLYDSFEKAESDAKKIIKEYDLYTIKVDGVLGVRMAYDIYYGERLVRSLYINYTYLNVGIVD